MARSSRAVSAVRGATRRPYPAGLDPPSGSLEEEHRRSEAVQERPPADRTDLAGAEHAGGGPTGHGGHQLGVVMGLVEEVTASAVAGEQQRTGGVVTGQQRAELGVGGG